MVRPALAVAVAAALCAAAIAPPDDQATTDDIAIGAPSPDGIAPGLGHHAMIVPARPVVPALRTAIVTPWVELAAPGLVAADDRLAIAPKTSPPG